MRKLGSVPNFLIEHSVAVNNQTLLWQKKLGSGPKFPCLLLKNLFDHLIHSCYKMIHSKFVTSFFTFLLEQRWLGQIFY